MRRFIVALIAVIGFTTFCPLAWADGDPTQHAPAKVEPKPEAPEVPALILTPEQNMCLDRCLSGGDQAQSCPPPPVCVEAKKEVKKKARATARAARKAIKTVKNEVKVVKQRLQEAKTSSPPCPKCVEDLRGELSSSLKRLGKLEGTIEGLTLLGGKIPELKGRVSRLEVLFDQTKAAVQIEIDSIKEKVEDHERRIEKVETEIKVVKRPVALGPRIGFVGIFARDGKAFTGPPIGAELLLRLSDSWSVSVAPGLALTKDEEKPVGITTTLQAGVSAKANRWIALRFGGVGIWSRLNSDNLPQVTFAGGYVGGGLHFWRLILALDGLFTVKLEGGMRPAVGPGFGLSLSMPLPEPF
jgi:hypothetical protein